jgi:mannitol-specific phosphotransferase system IIBC component
MKIIKKVDVNWANEYVKRKQKQQEKEFNAREKAYQERLKKEKSEAKNKKTDADGASRYNEALNMMNDALGSIFAAEHILQKLIKDSPLDPITELAKEKLSRVDKVANFFRATWKF